MIFPQTTDTKTADGSDLSRSRTRSVCGNRASNEAPSGLCLNTSVEALGSANRINQLEEVNPATVGPFSEARGAAARKRRRLLMWHTERSG
jgi:hypothetical protein